MGRIVFIFVALLNERFWGCLQSHATIPFLKDYRAGRSQKAQARKAPRKGGNPRDTIPRSSSYEMHQGP